MPNTAAKILQVPKHSLPTGLLAVKLPLSTHDQILFNMLKQRCKCRSCTPEQFQPPKTIDNVKYEVFNKASLSTRCLYEQIIFIVRVRRRSDVLGRDRRGWDTLGHLLHPRDLQLR